MQPHVRAEIGSARSNPGSRSASAQREGEPDRGGSVLAPAQFELFLERERCLADRGTRRFSLLTLRATSGASALDELARAARRRLRSTDVVGRLGSGRLGLLLTDTEPAGAAVVSGWVVQAAQRLGLGLEQAICVYPSVAEAALPAGESAALPPLVDLWPLLDVPTPLWKRSLDVLVSSSALILLLPFFGFIALAIRIDSRGPVIFRQRRAGRGGRPFDFYKFRSMSADAEQRRAELAAQNEQVGPVFKMRADPRVTRVGRLLRRWSIDELPQLWNVLRGDISLVGPRSPTLDELRSYERWQRRRLAVAGGITCTWQVSGRSQIPFHEWMRLDLRYVACRNLWLDLRLLARTLPAVLSGRGAY